MSKSSSTSKEKRGIFQKSKSTNVPLERIGTIPGNKIVKNFKFSKKCQRIYDIMLLFYIQHYFIKFPFFYIQTDRIELDELNY